MVDLSADQAAQLGGGDVTVDSSPSANVFFVYTNTDPAVSPITSNPGFQEAVRYGIDYDALVGLAGEGSSQTPGVIPTTFLGALDPSDAIQRDTDAGRAGAGRQRHHRPDRDAVLPERDPGQRHRLR